MNLSPDGSIPLAGILMVSWHPIVSDTVRVGKLLAGRVQRGPGFERID
jgi:hypothetical protein